VRLTAIYVTASVTVCSPQCGAGAREMIGAQAMIDSTGKAADVLRRIQVRIGISNLLGPFPNYAIESGETLCKRFTIAPPSDPAPGSGDPACSLN
jgi:hypothetical protein